MLLLVLLALPLTGQAQRRGTVYDTLQVPARSYLVLSDTSIFMQQDTIVILPDTLRAKVKSNTLRDAREFYKNLQQQFYKTKVTRELFDMLFRIPGQPPVSDTLSAEKSSNPYQGYDGKIIGNIITKRLDPFGPQVTDTARNAKGWVAETANDLHMKTRNRVILNNLLVKPGDRLDPAGLGDNERLLRDLPFIRDARVYVMPRPDDADTVDLLVITKDVWSISVDIRPSSLTSGSLTIGQSNLLGLGHELDYRFIFDPDMPQEVGSQTIYRVPNIRGSFIQLEADHAETYRLDRYRFRLERLFVAPSIKYAGGLELSTQQENRSLRFSREENDELVFPVHFNQYDGWLARAFPVKIAADPDGDRSQLVVGARYRRLLFTKRPQISADTNQIYRSTNTLLASVGISYRDFYRSTLIYGFGRTEDIPVGYRFTFTTGPERGELYDRWYHGFSFARGKIFGNKSYLRGEANLGGFFRKKRFEQGVLDLEANYFTPLLKIKTYRIRQFVNLEYVLGIRRFTNEFITLQDNRGIRGLGGFDLRGTRKINARLETVVFTPYALVGFNIAGYVFADLGFVSGRNQPLLSGNFFQGYGLGFRIRNENLAFSTFHIRFGVYPNPPADGQMTALEISGTESLDIRDFDIRTPQVLEFD